MNQRKKRKKRKIRQKIFCSQDKIRWHLEKLKPVENENEARRQNEGRVILRVEVIWDIKLTPP